MDKCPLRRCFGKLKHLHNTITYEAETFIKNRVGEIMPVTGDFFNPYLVQNYSPTKTRGNP